MGVRRGFDGKTMTTASGTVFRVYEPAWWQVWRWVYFWMFAPITARCQVTWNGEPMQVRAVAERLRLDEPAQSA